ncbi:MAG: GYD domain-containing protein [Terracidiphilus sp.]
MPSYLLQASYSTEALRVLIKKPEDRTEVVRRAVEKLGGKLVGLWLSFGDQDVVCIIEMPNNVSAAAISLAIGAGGALKTTRTTSLLSVDEGIAALKKASTSGYSPVTSRK